jgi:hypothetical protein
MLRRMFGPKRDEVKGEWRKLYEAHNDLYSSPNIVRVIKYRRMRWAGHIAQLCDGRGVCSALGGNPREREHWRDRGVDGGITLRWIFRN